MENFPNNIQQPQADFTAEVIQQRIPLEDNQDWDQHNFSVASITKPQKNTLLFNLAKLGLVIFLLILALYIIPSFISYMINLSTFDDNAPIALIQNKLQNQKDQSHKNQDKVIQNQANEKPKNTEKGNLGQTIQPLKLEVSNNVDSIKTLNNQKQTNRVQKQKPKSKISAPIQKKQQHNKKFILLQRKPLPSNISLLQKNFSTKLKNSLLNRDDELDKEQFQRYEEKYQISKFQKQIPFCIVVPTFNNEAQQRYLRNIQSINAQNYTNYRVFIIDDASTDKTGQLIQKYLMQNKLKDKFTFIRNQKQLTAMPNLRKAAIQLCKSYEIYLIVDGDDQLVGKQVLKLYNAMFQKTKSWFIYSNFLSQKGIGFSRPFHNNIIQDNLYREAALLTSHLRAFYTKLFQLIKQQDLKSDTNKQYFHAANDVAICIPVLEMSHKRITYISQITYYYNLNTGLNNHSTKKNQQKKNQFQIRSKKQKYKSLDTLFTDEQIKNGGLEFLNGDL